MSSPKLPIETERLRLRRFEPTDLDAIMGYYFQDDVKRYLDWKMRDGIDVRAALATMCSQVSLQRPGDVYTLAIQPRSGGPVIGHVSLRWADATAGQGEIRFVINSGYRGRGLATEAVEAMLDLAFRQFQIHRIFARCDARNSRSARLLQRVGMRLEAHYREHALFQGEWDEELHFAMLDREWRRSDKVRELHHKVA